MKVSDLTEPERKIWEAGTSAWATFHQMALDTLKAVRARQPGIPEVKASTTVLDAADVKGIDLLDVGETTRRRLQGRYGARTPDLFARAQAG